MILEIGGHTMLPAVYKVGSMLKLNFISTVITVQLDNRTEIGTRVVLSCRVTCCRDMTYSS